MVRTSRKEPKVGDLVHHYIFPRHEWIGLLLRIEQRGDGYSDKALVRMVPGVKYESYFTNLRRSENGQGWLYKKWLWVYDGGKTDAEIINAYFHRE